MAYRTEHAFTELGYFQKRDCEAIKERLQGKTFLKFDIRWSSYAGNCTLVVQSGIEAHADGSEVTDEELVGMFLHVALGEIGAIMREVDNG